MKRFFLAVFLTAVCAFSACPCGQAQDFSGFWKLRCEWMEGPGAAFLASFAHPNDTYEGYEIVSCDSSRLVVEIAFRSFIHAYTSRYEIARGDHDGMPYFRHVTQLSNGTPTRSFTRWSKQSRYSAKYREDNLSRMYGALYFSDLSYGKMAAAALEIEFLQTRIPD
ncbi:MAG: hypothetical protein IJ651_08240 [Bacteroidales bacterium]|nr:hypothetical protein [Bacteroidales bacterium]